MIVATALSAGSAFAQTTGTWTTNGPGNWSDTTKWSGGVVAGGVGATADFSTLDITADNVVTLDAPVTLGTLKVADLTTLSNNWVFAGTNTLTFDNGASQPVLEIVNRFPVISAPIAGTNGISKTGAGTVTFSGDNSGLSGTLNLPDVIETNNAGVVFSGTSAVGGLTTININGTSNTSGQYLALTGNTTVGSGVTINLGSQGGNYAPAGGLRAEGDNTNIVTVEGPLNVTLAGNAARIANNSAKRMDITGPINGGTNGVTFRFGKNEGIHITNTGNTWGGTTVHSQETFWFEPGALPTTTNLQLCASAAGHVQTSGTFTRALGDGPNQVQFTLNAGRVQGFGARGGALTLNFGGAGADVLFDTATAAAANRIRTNTLVLNGATADSNITLVNPLDINGAARSIQVSSQTAILQGGIKGGTFAVSKTSIGTLEIAAASTWTGDLTLAAGTRGNVGVVRLSHNEALGAPATVKSVNLTGGDQAIGLIELPGGIAIDENKTLKMCGKYFYGNNQTALGNQAALRSIGTNTWAGSALIAYSGGSYGIESTSGTLTLGTGPSTSKLMRNEVAGTSTRVLSWFGAGDVVMNLKMADNGAADFSFIKVGSGTLAITRGDNDFDQTPHLRSGITEVVKLADSGTASSLGTGLVGAGINVGATLSYLGTGDTCNRPVGILQTGATLDSSGTGGPLVLSSATMSHQAGTTSTPCAPFASGATTLLLSDPSGIAVGQTITGTNIPAGTTITSVDVDTRAIGISQATTAASTTGLDMTIGGANNLDRTLTLTGTNTGDNLFAASLSNPGAGKLGITKTGPGKWILSGATKTCSGPVDVQEGTLGIRGPLPAGALTVAPTATLSLDNTSLSGTPAVAIAGTLDLAGPVVLNLAPSVTTAGTYTALEYGALAGGGTLTTVYRGASFDTTTNPTSTTLTIGEGVALTWTGSPSATWDVMTTPNWVDGASNPETFHFLDSVTFDETGALQPIVTIAQEVRPFGISVSNPSTDYSFTGSGFISGVGGLAKTGAAKLTLGTANTFSGGIDLAEGTIAVANNQALGANGQVVTIADGATLDTAGALSANRDYEAVITGNGLAGEGAIVNTGADHQSGFRSLTLNGPASVGGTGRWDVRPLTAGTGAINLNGNTLTKLGTNLIAFVEGSMTTDGSIDINSGILSLTRMTTGGAGSLNANNGATLRFENNTAGAYNYAKAISINDATAHLTGSDVTINAPITLTGTGTFSIAFTRTFVAAQPVDGSGSLNFISAGTGAVGVLVLQDDNTYNGATTVDTGTLRIGNRTATGSINTLPVTLANNGNLQISRSDNTCVFPNTIEGAGNVLIGTGVALNAAITEPEYDSLVTLTGTNTFTGNVFVYSGGLRILDAAALGTGAKTVNVGAYSSAGTNGRPQFYLDGSGGNIIVPATVGFRTSSTLMTHPAIGNLAGDNVIEGTITLDAGGGSTAVKVIGGSLTLNGAVAANASGRYLILGSSTAGTPGTINGVIGDGTSALGLTMEGPNTWTLTAPNTYTGATTVTGGTLEVNGNQGLATGAVAVTGGTLGGTGTVGGNITVEAAGTLAPGLSVGTFTAVNSVTLNGHLAIEIDGANADKVVVGSTLNITNATLDLTEITPISGEPVVIATYGALAGTQFAAVNGLPAGYALDYNHNSLNQIALVVSTATAYEGWATTHAGGQTAELDFDGDGVPNGVEFFLGESGSTFTANPGLVDGKVTWPKSAGFQGTYEVQTSPDLAVWTAQTLGVVDNGTSVEYTVPTGEPRIFVRLAVTPQ